MRRGVSGWSSQTGACGVTQEPSEYQKKVEDALEFLGESFRELHEAKIINGTIAIYLSSLTQDKRIRAYQTLMEEGHSRSFKFAATEHKEYEMLAKKVRASMKHKRHVYWETMEQFMKMQDAVNTLFGDDVLDANTSGWRVRADRGMLGVKTVLDEVRDSLKRGSR